MDNTKENPIEKARAVVDKIKAEKAIEESQELAKAEEAKNELDLIKNNSVLAAMYQENSSVGSENLGGETPQLKIHSVGRSQNELADGTEPKDGAFFYKPTAEQFSEVNCHILTISKGFRAPGFGDDNKDKEVFNQILGGVIIEDSGYKPFIMYFTGLKLSKLWEFGKSVTKFTNAKPFSIPMFALTVKMTTEKVPTDYGKSWIINFDVVKNSDGKPKLITDETTFAYIRNQVDSVQEMIDNMIEAKASNRTEVIEEARQINTIQAEEPIKQMPEEQVEGIDDLPF